VRAGPASSTFNQAFFPHNRISVQLKTCQLSCTKCEIETLEQSDQSI
jgi:hypothetical protein